MYYMKNTKIVVKNPGWL